MKNRSMPDADVLLVAIRAKCMDCSGRIRSEVENCRLTECPLYPYRSVKAVFGANAKTDAGIDGQIGINDILEKAVS